MEASLRKTGKWDMLRVGEERGTSVTGERDGKRDSFCQDFL